MNMTRILFRSERCQKAAKKKAKRRKKCAYLSYILGFKLRIQKKFLMPAESYSWVPSGKMDKTRQLLSGTSIATSKPNNVVWLHLWLKKIYIKKWFPLNATIFPVT